MQGLALLGLKLGRVQNYALQLLLGGSWVVISRVIIKVTILITRIRGLITPTYNYP